MSLIEELEDEAMRLSASSFRNGCPDCGIACNLAGRAATQLEAMQAEVERIPEEMKAELVKTLQAGIGISHKSRFWNDDMREGCKALADYICMALDIDRASLDNSKEGEK